MDARQAQDNRRLLRSSLAALVLHAVVLLALMIVIAVNGAPVSERVGMITLNLEAGPPAPAAQFRAEKDDPPAPQPSAPIPPPAKPKADEPKVAAVKTTESKNAAAAVEKTKTTTSKTAADKDGTARESAPSDKNEIATRAVATRSQLEQGSLSRLDEALKRAGDGEGSDGGSGGGKGGGGGGSRSSTSWEDRAVRELLSRASPVIPRWVSEQGLRLKVELAVELNADGLVYVRNVRTSSGYPDVDAAVTKAVSRWKYSRGAGTQAVRGTVTYYIELK